MPNILLKTKLHRPLPGRTVIPRPRIEERLHIGLEARLTLVSAPAGFGKSTLVSCWISDRLEAKSEASSQDLSEPIALATWLSLDETDILLPTFISHCVAAIRERHPQSCQLVVDLLEQMQSQASIEALVDAVCQSLESLQSPLVLVLDDLHVIDDPGVYAFLTGLVQNAPRQFHLVLITRVDPPLPLSRWRARGYVNELRMRDLSFTLDEARIFLTENLDEPPPDELVATLHQRTEGWAVGLWLARLALRGQKDLTLVASQMDSVGSRYIVDYLVDEVLDHQPTEVQEFLIATALLNRFNAELCAVVVGIDTVDAESRIQDLLRENLFLIELSAPSRWYRYHHQFQDMLLSRLHTRCSQETIRQLHRRAATWLTNDGQVDEALRHLLAIPDPVAAADLVESRRLSALQEQRFFGLSIWLGAVPLTMVYQRPLLLVALAWVHFDQVDKRQCLAALARAEVLLEEMPSELSSSTRQMILLECFTLRLAMDHRAFDPAQALENARDWWSQLRSMLLQVHFNVPLQLAYSVQRLGDVDLALEIILTTVEAMASWPIAAKCRLLHTAGYVYWCGGNLAEAERTFLRNLQLAQQHELTLIAHISHHGFGAIADARNQPQIAEQHHLEVLKNPHLNGGRDAVMDLFALIRIYAHVGQPDKARLLVEELKGQTRTIHRPHLHDQIAALEAFVEQVSGNVPAACAGH
ncbi:MAG: AAA family ATPase, partial [Caldilineaceae bacterium]|nr:AAA family ATPase [Caldilineaceae bacterium]